MEKSRENRRHHLRRMKAKARHVARYSWGYRSSKDIKRAEKWANHLKLCSCFGCCNPRRSGYYKNEVTRQEWLAYLKFLEESGHDDRVKHCRYRKVDGNHEADYRAGEGGPFENGSRHE